MVFVFVQVHKCSVNDPMLDMVFRFLHPNEKLPDTNRSVKQLLFIPSVFCWVMQIEMGIMERFLLAEATGTKQFDMQFILPKRPH